MVVFLFGAWWALQTPWTCLGVNMVRSCCRKNIWLVNSWDCRLETVEPCLLCNGNHGQTYLMANHQPIAGDNSRHVISDSHELYSPMAITVHTIFRVRPLKKYHFGMVPPQKKSRLGGVVKCGKPLRHCKTRRFLQTTSGCWRHRRPVSCWSSHFREIPDVKVHWKITLHGKKYKKKRSKTTWGIQVREVSAVVMTLNSYKWTYNSYK